MKQLNTMTAQDFTDSWIKKNGLPIHTSTRILEKTIAQIAHEYAQQKVKSVGLADVSGSLRYSEREIDFAYLAGVFNVSGIDGLQKEIERLK